MQTTILTQEYHKSYQDFIKNHPNSRFEHSLEWANLLNKHFKFQIKHIISTNDQNKISSALPLFQCQGLTKSRLIASPYSITTAPLVTNDTNDSEKQIQNLINFAKDLTKTNNQSYLEVRTKQDNNELFKQFQQSQNVFNFEKDITPSKEELLKSFPKSSVRWGIKKSIKENLTIKSGTNTELLDQFYKLYLKTRKHRGVPSYPKAFMHDILNNHNTWQSQVPRCRNKSFCARKSKDFQGWDIADINKDSFHSKLYLTYKGNKAIAGCMIIYYKDNARYYYAATTQNKAHLKLQPYHFCIWEAIKDAKNQGYKTLDFGGATEQTNNGGLYNFKKRWSDTITPIYSYFYLNTIDQIPSQESKATKLASKLWKHLPTSIINKISPHIIKRFV